LAVLSLLSLASIGFSTFVFGSSSGAGVNGLSVTNGSVLQYDIFVDPGSSANPFSVTSEGIIEDETFVKSGTVTASFSFKLDRAAAKAYGYLANDGTSSLSTLSIKASLTQTKGASSYDFLTSAGASYLAYGSTSSESSATLSDGALSSSFSYSSSSWVGTLGMTLSFKLTIPSAVSSDYSSFYSAISNGSVSFKATLEALKP